VVVVSFMSNNVRSMLLPAQLQGEVVQLDSVGDALVKFDGLQSRQWVRRSNFAKLRDVAVAAKTATKLQARLAGTLTLAHRWQVCGLVEVLEERLERGITVESFPASLEAAALQVAGRLWKACKAFATNSPQVLAAFAAGSYSKPIMELLQQLLNVEQGSETKKRPREAL